MNKEENIIPISSIITPIEEEIEVLDESDFTPAFDVEVDNSNSSIDDTTIKNNDLDINASIKTSTLDDTKKITKNNDKKIEKIQIGLILFLIVSASLIYFFGYDLLEPFIKID